MLSIQDLILSIDITEPQVKSICRFLFKKEKDQTLTTGECMVVLVCDFLRQTGMSFEEYINIGHQFNNSIVEHGKVLERALIVFTDGQRTAIPWCFLTMIDNRYVGLQRSETEDTPDLYDLKDEQLVPRTPAPPMFTVTVAVTALYMRTLAAKNGYEKAAEYFNKGLLIGECQAED